MLQALFLPRFSKTAKAHPFMVFCDAVMRGIDIEKKRKGAFSLTAAFSFPPTCIRSIKAKPFSSTIQSYHSQKNNKA